MEIKREKNELEFVGILNESVTVEYLLENFHSISADSSVIILNFEKVKRANSCGIITLIHSIEQVKLPVHFSRCPVWLVEQLNQIAEFFTLNIKIISVFAPYIEEKTEQYILKLINIDDDFIKNGTLQSLDEQINDNGLKIVADFDSEDFFGFITRYKK